MSPQVRNAIAAAAIYIAAVGLAWKLTGHIDPVQVVIVIGFIWFLGLNVARDERDEETRADVDETARRVDAITAHLTGNDLDSNGRHATPATEPPRYERPVPYPRSDAA